MTTKEKAMITAFILVVLIGLAYFIAKIQAKPAAPVHAYEHDRINIEEQDRRYAIQTARMNEQEELNEDFMRAETTEQKQARIKARDEASRTANK